MPEGLADVRLYLSWFLDQPEDVRRVAADRGQTCTQRRAWLCPALPYSPRACGSTPSLRLQESLRHDGTRVLREGRRDGL
jgi:hypothetical protein